MTTKRSIIFVIYKKFYQVSNVTLTSLRKSQRNINKIKKGKSK